MGGKCGGCVSMKKINKTTADVRIEKRQWQCEQGDENEVEETNRSYAPGAVRINRG